VLAARLGGSACGPGSRIGPAFSTNLGSRGKIHERCCHGLIASSANQRPIVDADAALTACSTTKR
jgi:hypothetical protein